MRFDKNSYVVVSGISKSFYTEVSSLKRRFRIFIVNLKFESLPSRRSLNAIQSYKAVLPNIYVYFCLSGWIIFVFELRNQADIFLDIFSLFFHVSDIICAFLVPNSFEHLLILLNYSKKFSFSVGFMQKDLISICKWFVVFYFNIGVFGAYKIIKNWPFF